ncbi:peptidase S1 [Paracoccus sp. NSM]|uniref:peptidase S1 n=1 Tax=Paracoccus sp. NSM TaxID=3457784 RepID=UPI00403683B0
MLRSCLHLKVCLGLAIAATPLAAAAQDCPDWRLVAPKTIEASATSLFSRYQTPLIAGGSVNLTSCLSMPGIGYLAEAPDLSVEYDGQGDRRLLDIRVQSDCDTTLLVNLPDEQYVYSDDEDGLNPVIRISAAQTGLYDIWVGTIEPANCAAILMIETFDES